MRDYRAASGNTRKKWLVLNCNVYLIIKIDWTHSHRCFYKSHFVLFKPDRY
jgi:hypothetical protein